MLRLAAGFLRPQRGSVYVNGIATDRWQIEAMHQLMSYCLQEGNLVDEKVGESLEWSCATLSADQRRLQIEQVLRRVWLYDEIDLDQQTTSLSLGQQQRLVLARLLLDSSPILLIDEPFTGLDVFTLRDIHGELQALLRSERRTIVMVSHKLNFASFADHVVVLKQDFTIEQGAPSELIKDPDSRFATLYRTARDELLIQ